jgi:hypothetical protein
VVVHPPPQHLHSFLSPSSASTVAILTILVSSILLVLVLLLIIKLQKKSRIRPNHFSSSYASPLPLGSGLSPGLTHISTANSPGLNLDGNFVSFSPSSFYGVGDSILDPVKARRESAESAKHFRIKHFRTSNFLLSSPRTRRQEEADGSCSEGTAGQLGGCGGTAL